MNIHEYQAKKIFRKFKITVPCGRIAYTPDEAREAAQLVSPSGPWVVKAQIQAGSRDIGKFSDKRAGKKGGIRISKTLDDVYENADEMLENQLITNQTGAKGRLVSRVYIEEFIKTERKFYLGLVVDWVAASTVLLVAPVTEKDDAIVKLALEHPDKILKIDLGLQKSIQQKQLQLVLDFMNSDFNADELRAFLNNMLKVFYAYGSIWALDAKIVFDNNALYRHPEIDKLSDNSEIEERELIASKYGFQYKELDNGIGIIVNGDGLALSTISQAEEQEIDTACFLNLKGGVDREKIAASIKLIMTNPRVDGIFINILGGFLRCNLIADGIIAVANDLGLNIPLVVRFEGTNKDEATDILQKSGLPLSIVSDTREGLSILKSAIAEDL